MQFKDILYKAPLLSTSGDTYIEILDIADDSRKVVEGSVFIAVKGLQSDGHQFIETAIQKGAKAIICEVIPEKLIKEITYVQVADSAKTLGILASNFFDNPSQKLELIGVTGTNGKTTTVTLLFKLFRALGYNVGLISTIQNQINDQIFPSTHTTPDPIALNKLLSEMVKKKCHYAFMEVSSHAVVQERIAGLKFAGGIFTNITHDHLDFHGNFDNYIKAKKSFFDQLPSSAFALTNLDDKRGMVMLQNTKALKKTFSLQTIGDFKGKLLTNTLHGLEMDMDGREVWFKLVGNFNAYNLLTIYATAILLGEDKENVLTHLSALSPAPGRFDQIISKNNTIGIIDYAHTPDALENVLKTIQELKENNQVITVVGCGGNRDASKRPIMAEIASKYSDKVILTSDNPRNEEPKEILNQMYKGVGVIEKKKVSIIEDRKTAISTAVSLAKQGDIILIAGKGHENYQEIKGVKYPFDDKMILIEMFK